MSFLFSLVDFLFFLVHILVFFSIAPTCCCNSVHFPCVGSIKAILILILVVSQCCHTVVTTQTQLINIYQDEEIISIVCRFGPHSHRINEKVQWFASQDQKSLQKLCLLVVCFLYKYQNSNRQGSITSNQTQIFFWFSFSFYSFRNEQTEN